MSDEHTSSNAQASKAFFERQKPKGFVAEFNCGVMYPQEEPDPTRVRQYMDEEGNIFSCH